MITIEEAKTRINLPSFDQLAVDGYAVCFSDQIATSFMLVAEVKTGDTKPIQLKKGECARIFTGAMIPKGTKAVVMQEKERKRQYYSIQHRPFLYMLW